MHIMVSYLCTPLHTNAYALPICVVVAMPTRVPKARIACLDFSLQKAKMHLGVQVVVSDPEKLDAIRQR